MLARVYCRRGILGARPKDYILRVFRVLGTLVRADGDDFDFDQDAGGRKGCYLERAASGFVGLFLCAEIFCVGGHEASEIHFVVLRRIANQIDMHHDDIGEREPL